MTRTWSRDGLTVTITRSPSLSTIYVWCPAGSKWCSAPARELHTLPAIADAALVSLWMRARLVCPVYGRRIHGLRRVMPAMIAQVA